MHIVSRSPVRGPAGQRRPQLELEQIINNNIYWIILRRAKVPIVYEVAVFGEPFKSRPLCNWTGNYPLIAEVFSEENWVIDSLYPRSLSVSMTERKTKTESHKLPDK